MNLQFNLRVVECTANTILYVINVLLLSATAIYKDMDTNYIEEGLYQ